MKLFAVVSIGLFLPSIINAAPIVTKRRFGVEHTQEADQTYEVMKNAGKGTKFEDATGSLVNDAVLALLANAEVCDQQKVAERCIDLARQIGAEVDKSRETTLISACQTYRTLERNTPVAGQPSELCTIPVVNKELEGLTQRQDPTGLQTKLRRQNDNVAFTNPVGGVQMPKITKLSPGGSDGNFEVNGSKFQQVGAAHNRQCDIQHNLCFNKFNAGDRSFQGSDCDNQNNVCKAGPPVFA
ncbi:hypothetical protein Glove_187g67 [Diversispora epigaea]|uniref:Uncharacterized protein n=1 Tax=Diversispora epigaea TaxID=1348612 RepID=A0A397ILY1_9GLOM|nr:hypothetical protein Glove_187g67 [Diversispora epigaea]